MVIVIETVKPRFFVVINVPKQVFRLLHAVRADPFTNGVEAFDKAKLGHGIAGVSHFSGLEKVGNSAITNWNRHKPAAIGPLRLPNGLLVGFTFIL